MLKKFLDKLQKKPLKERKRILWVSVAFIGVVIFLAWLFVFPHESTVPPEKSQATREKLEKSKQEIKEITDKVSFSNISSDVKEATEEIIKENKKEEEKIIEIPRLPMEK
jgi:hypothetical protein